MLKSTRRPLLAPVPHPTPSRSSCPQAAHLSTGTHPIHSTCRVKAEPRKDQHLRREWWNPRGPGGKSASEVLTGWKYREYAQARQLESQSRIPLTLPKLLDAFHALSNPVPSSSFQSSPPVPQTPSKTAYLLLLSSAAEYSEQVRYMNLQNGGSGIGYERLAIDARKVAGEQGVDKGKGKVLESEEGEGGAEGVERVEEVWRRVIHGGESEENTESTSSETVTTDIKSEPTRPISSTSTRLPRKDRLSFFGLAPDRLNLGLKIALCAYEDARLGGLDLGIEGFDLLLKAASPYPALIPHLMNHLRTTMGDILPVWTSKTMEYSMRGSLRAGGLEDTLLALAEARRRGVDSELERGYVGRAIGTCCDWGYVKVALGLAEREDGRSAVGGEGVGVMAWVEILRCSADLYFLEGVEKGWERAITQNGYKPDEGLCINILNVAGRYGLPDLATSVISQLAIQGIKLQEYHLAPLLESFAHGGKMADAMEVLEVMRTTAGVSPTLATADPIVRILSGEDRLPEERTKILDTAFYALEALKMKGKVVDVAAFNAVLKASSNQRQYQRAIAIYQQAGSMGVRPNTETYNTLLAMCVKLKARKQADALLKDMDEPKPLPTDPVDGPKPEPIKWDELTYETMISLCLTQNPYEDAFFFLEKMKAEKIRPPGINYERIAAKLLSVNDPRYRAVLDEMQLNNYTPSATLMKFDRMVKEGKGFSYDDLKPEALVGDWSKAINEMVKRSQRGYGQQGSSSERGHDSRGQDGGRRPGGAGPRKGWGIHSGA